MNRKIILILLVLALMSIACNLTSGANQPAEPTSTAVQSEAATPTIEEPTEEPLPTTPPEPTPTDPPVEEPTPTEVEPAPTEEGPVEYTETFDRDNGDWSEDIIVTTQTFGRDLDSKGTISNGVMTLHMGDKETYMYKFFLYTAVGTVSIQSDYLARGHINNGIALVCRANEDLTSWFEARVSSTSDYSFYQYDLARKEEEGKNPYIQLSKGKIDVKELAPSKENTIMLTCSDEELILDVNNGKRVISQVVETPLAGEFLGIGGMSYDIVPINIDFDNITISQE